MTGPGSFVVSQPFARYTKGHGIRQQPQIFWEFRQRTWFEAQLWTAGDKMRGHMAASESRTPAALRNALPLKLLSGGLRAPAAAQAANKKWLQ
jgi:hypothetical protein